MPGVLRIAYPTFIHYEFYVPVDADNHLYVGVMADFKKGLRDAALLPRSTSVSSAGCSTASSPAQDKWMVEVTDAPPEQLYRPDDSLLKWRKLAEDVTEDRVDALAEPTGLEPAGPPAKELSGRDGSHRARSGGLPLHPDEHALGPGRAHRPGGARSATRWPRRATAVAAAPPDVVIIVGSNHFRGFWLDLIPAFTLGVGEVIGAGRGRHPEGSADAPIPAFAQALAGELVERGTEVAISARLQIDHGQTHAIQYLLRRPRRPGRAAGDQRVRRPAAARRPLRAAGPQPRRGGRRRSPEDRRVVVIASGGLSHQLPWPADWRDPQNADEEFLVEAWLNGRGEWERYDKRRREIITAARPTIFEDFDEAFLADLETGKLRALRVLLIERHRAGRRQRRPGAAHLADHGRGARASRPAAGSPTPRCRSG